MKATSKNRGMTLLEVLVTLVIVGMVAALAAQGMQQLARIERQLEELGADGQQRMLRREWLRSLVAAALPEQQSTPLQFVGNPLGFQISTALALEVPRLALAEAPDSARARPTPVASLRIELSSEGPNGPYGLRLRPSAPGETRLAVNLLAWNDAPGRIHYQDHDGQWHERWPVNAEAVRRPPAMVRIDMGAEAGGVLLAPVAGREPPRPRLADWVDG